ncbi:hypothetical protein GJ744_002025 [Endocarpon pusillum]|uniref:RING-type domain-containing protein n=1 Tax=Endocarpon pusillum TaxID=364733 RepID=A0A8H7E1G4_9EURO|nr:hypothetical protein GJ744_002025 [Endocarpon pusillum]
MAQDVYDKKSAAPESQTLPEHIATAGSETCVICLETISERAVALPCKHDCFDFPCLGNWLTKHTTCPLCKGKVERLEYEFNVDLLIEAIDVSTRKGVHEDRNL